MTLRIALESKLKHENEDKEFYFLIPFVMQIYVKNKKKLLRDNVTLPYQFYMKNWFTPVELQARISSLRFCRLLSSRH